TTGFTPDGLSAAGAAIGPIAGLVEDSDGRLYFGQASPAGVRRIASAYAGLPWQDRLEVPGDGGESLRIFDAQGRLREERDAETGLTLKTVDYDAAGQLASVTDEYDRTTTYERDGAGRIAAVVSPTGQRTRIAYNAFGQPETITHPDGAVWGLEYDAAGLLTDYTDPNDHTTTFAYDSLNRLIRDTDAAGGGWKSIEYDLDPEAQQVRYTSAEDRVHGYTARTDTETGVRTSIDTSPTGGETRSLSDPLARTTTTTAPDGTRTITEVLPSAVPSGAAADSRTTIRLPSGLTYTSESA
ncbi:RHS repeat protein, partial [Thiorhodococcus minor]|nr:RHS repeat protein [Thiorhodococcus minor]